MALPEILDGEWTPCVLVLDLRMPRISGWELVARLRADDRWDHLPLIIVAAYYRIAEEAERLGAHAWLQKPIDIGRLVGIVEDACGGSNGKVRHA